MSETPETPAKTLRAAGIRPADVRASLPEPVPDRTWYRWLHQASGGGNAGMLFRALCRAIAEQPPA